jgi:hypothetical protein
VRVRAIASEREFNNLLLVCFCFAGDAYFLLCKQRLGEKQGVERSGNFMIAVVNLIEQSKMTNEQNRSSEIIPTAPMYPDLDRLEHLDPTHSIDILALFALLTGINKLRRSIGKLRKQGKCSPELLFPILSALLAIVRAIEQMNDGE